MTALSWPGDDLMIYAVEQCRPGDVLVVATISPCTDGLFGERAGNGQGQYVTLDEYQRETA